MRRRWPEILLEEATCKWGLKLGKDRTLGDRAVCVRKQEPGGGPSRTSSSARDTPRGAADGDEGPSGCNADTPARGGRGEGHGSPGRQQWAPARVCAGHVGLGAS